MESRLQLVYSASVNVLPMLATLQTSSCPLVLTVNPALVIQQLDVNLDAKDVTCLHALLKNQPVLMDKLKSPSVLMVLVNINANILLATKTVSSELVLVSLPLFLLPCVPPLTHLSVQAGLAIPVLSVPVILSQPHLTPSLPASQVPHLPLFVMLLETALERLVHALPRRVQQSPVLLEKAQFEAVTLRPEPMFGSVPLATVLQHHRSLLVKQVTR